MIKELHRDTLVLVNFYNVFKVWNFYGRYKNEELSDSVFKLVKTWLSKSNKDNPK